MIGTIALELLLILLLLMLNGVFAMSEIAVVSARRARLERLATSGNRGARPAIDLAASPRSFLSTVQVGITVIGILAGAYGGATIAEQLALAFGSLPPVAPFAEEIAIGIVVMIISYLSLILGELVPKRLALNHPERIAAAVARPISLLARLTAPAVRFLGASSDAVLWLIRARPSAEPAVTEDELRLMIEQGTTAGVLSREERDMLRRILLLGDRRVSSLMTPRTDIVSLMTDDTVGEIRTKIARGFSRFPVCEGSLDNLLGIVTTGDLLASALADGSPDLRRSLKQPQLVPESTLALQLLEQFRRTGTHLALVIDEYGGVQGLVTTSDILKAVVGSLAGMDAPTAVRRADGSWLIDGLLPIDELHSVLQVETISGEEGGDVQTVGGLVMSHLGRLPAAGDHCDISGFRFEVVDMDGNRVDMVLVSGRTPEK